MLQVYKYDGKYGLVANVPGKGAGSIELAMELARNGFPVYAERYIDLMNELTGQMDVKIEPYGVNSMDQINLWENYIPMPQSSRLVKPPYPRVLIEKARWEIYPYVDFDDSPPEELTK